MGASAEVLRCEAHLLRAVLEQWCERRGGGAWLVVDERQGRPGPHLYGLVLLPGKWTEGGTPAVDELRAYWTRLTGTPAPRRYGDWTKVVTGSESLVDFGEAGELLGAGGLPGVVEYATKQLPSGRPRDVDAEVFVSGTLRTAWRSSLPRAPASSASSASSLPDAPAKVPACGECGVPFVSHGDRARRRDRETCGAKCRRRRQRRRERYVSTGRMIVPVTDPDAAPDPPRLAPGAFGRVWGRLVAAFSRGREFTFAAAARVTAADLAASELVKLLRELADEDGTIERRGDAFALCSAHGISHDAARPRRAQNARRDRMAAKKKKLSLDERYPEISVAPDWPTHAEYEGQQVELREIVKRLRYDRFALACVLVDVPGHGRCYPWRSSAYEIDDKGNVSI